MLHSDADEPARRRVAVDVKMSATPDLTLGLGPHLVPRQLQVHQARVHRGWAWLRWIRIS